jgi:hypothetical protein
MASPPSQKQPASGARKIIPFFRSANIHDTVAFYKETLGMNSGPIYPSESNPRFVSLSTGPQAAVNIYFRIYGGPSDEDQQRGQAMVMLPTLEDVRSLHERFVECGVHRKGDADHAVQKYRERCDVSDVEDMEWGYRQFTLWDIDQNEIDFFAFLTDNK